jgi:HEAT repeat protein
MTQEYHEIIEELVANGDIDGLIDIAEHAKTTLASLAVHALGQLKAEKAVGLLLFQAVTGECWGKVRDAAILALGEIGNPVAVKPLTKLLEPRGIVKDDESPYVAELFGELVLKALGTFAKKGGVEATWSIINSLDTHWSTPARQVLKNLGDKAADSLIGSLKSVDKNPMKKAVIALGEIGSSKATKPLLAILAQYNLEDLDLLENVVQSLGKIKDAAAVEPIIDALKSNSISGDIDYRVQNLLISALGDMGDHRASKPLVQLLLQSSEFRVRWTAAYALAKIGAEINDDKVIEQLVGVLSN